MLVALNDNEDRIEASRELDLGKYLCPLCKSTVILKHGRVKVPHFAHMPGAVCDWAPESLAHQLAKRVLADRFRALGYTVELEEPHLDIGRRVDVAVEVKPSYRVAIEIQDSPISVREIERRNSADQKSGFFATTWVFTSQRASRLLDGGEVRVPEEMRWLHDRYGGGIDVIDEQQGQMWCCSLDTVVREGHDWYNSYGEEGYSSPRSLKAIKHVTSTETGFKLTAKSIEIFDEHERHYKRYLRGRMARQAIKHEWIVLFTKE